MVWDGIVIAGLQMAKITYPMERQCSLQKHTGFSLKLLRYISFHRNECGSPLLPSHVKRRGSIATSGNYFRRQGPGTHEDKPSKIHLLTVYLNS